MPLTSGFNAMSSAYRFAAGLRKEDRDRRDRLAARAAKRQARLSELRAKENMHFQELAAKRREREAQRNFATRTYSIRGMEIPFGLGAGQLRAVLTFAQAAKDKEVVDKAGAQAVIGQSRLWDDGARNNESKGERRESGNS